MTYKSYKELLDEYRKGNYLKVNDEININGLNCKICINELRGMYYGSSTNGLNSSIFADLNLIKKETIDNLGLVYINGDFPYLHTLHDITLVFLYLFAVSEKLWASTSLGFKDKMYDLVKSEPKFKVGDKVRIKDKELRFGTLQSLRSSTANLDVYGGFDEHHNEHFWKISNEGWYVLEGDMEEITETNSKYGKYNSLEEIQAEAKKRGFVKGVRFKCVKHGNVSMIEEPGHMYHQWYSNGHFIYDTKADKWAEIISEPKSNHRLNREEFIKLALDKGYKKGVKINSICDVSLGKIRELKSDRINISNKSTHWKIDGKFIYNNETGEWANIVAHVKPTEEEFKKLANSKGFKSGVKVINLYGDKGEIAGDCISIYGTGECTYGNKYIYNYKTNEWAVIIEDDLLEEAKRRYSVDYSYKIKSLISDRIGIIKPNAELWDDDNNRIYVRCNDGSVCIYNDGKWSKKLKESWDDIIKHRKPTLEEFVEEAERRGFRSGQRVRDIYGEHILRYPDENVYESGIFYFCGIRIWNDTDNTWMEIVDKPPAFMGKVKDVKVTDGQLPEELAMLVASDSKYPTDDEMCKLTSVEPLKYIEPTLIKVKTKSKNKKRRSSLKYY